MIFLVTQILIALKKVLYTPIVRFIYIYIYIPNSRVSRNPIWLFPILNVGSTQVFFVKIPTQALPRYVLGSRFTASLVLSTHLVWTAGRRELPVPSGSARCATAQGQGNSAAQPKAGKRKKKWSTRVTRVWNLPRGSMYLGIFSQIWGDFYGKCTRVSMEVIATS